ncbi:hypothetical protein ACQPYH_14675 [Kribbella sp. CA-245084]|uniref:hypothetical protein n=1 Tax=Kribbella sp. CA-245084 TaxID=3239940 RepID=UPI003D93AF6E
MTVLGTAKAVASVPFDQVQPFLTEARCKHLLGLDRANPAGVSVDADPAAGTVGMQGQYWYRGEYTFGPHPDGTEITYRIVNVSGSPDAVIRLWQRKVLNNQQRDLDAFAADLPSRLH